MPLASLCLPCFALLALLSLGCGLIRPDESVHVDDSEPMGECVTGDLRLSQTPCGETDFLIESCENEEWVLQSEECLDEPTCEDGQAIAHGEALGGYFFNEVLSDCRGGTAEGTRAACGAVEPTWGDNDNFGAVDDDDRVDELAGITFPFLMGFGPGGSSTDLSHVLCVDTLWTSGDYPPLPQLFGVERMYINAPGQMEQFGALRKVVALVVESTDDEDLTALGPLDEVRHLTVRDTSMLTLEGLGYLTERGSVELSGNEQLISIEAFSGLRSVLRSFLMDDVPVMGLLGLEELRTVGGRLRLPIVDEVSLQVLSNLEEVGEDLELIVYSPELYCTVVEFAEGIEIGGELMVFIPGQTSPSCAR